MTRTFLDKMRFLPKDTRLLLVLTKREYKTRYLGSSLGSFWSFIHPLVMILIYTLVFSKIMKSRLGFNDSPYAYSLYLCVGLIPWQLMMEIMNRGMGTLLENADFIKKLAFHPLILFRAGVISSLINFFISFFIFLVFLFLVNPVGPGLFLTFWVVLVMMIAFAANVGICFGCLNVFSRDVQQTISVIMQLWFWGTPVIYQVAHIPDALQVFLYLNPAYAFIDPMHKLLFYRTYPEPHFWALMLAWIALSWVLSRVIYKQTISLARDYL
jgi:lipopolysaccharide transport system permease protein